MRISCTECHTFVELPEPIGLLGKFVCADCRRARSRADATPIPNRPSAHEPPAALAARRAARASQPEIDPSAAPPSGPPDVSELVARVAPAEPSNPFALHFTPRQDVATHPTFEKPSTPPPAGRAISAPPIANPFAATPTAARAVQPPISAPPPPILATPFEPAPAKSSAPKLVVLALTLVAVAVGAGVLWRASRTTPVAAPAEATVAVTPPTAANPVQPAATSDKPAPSGEFDRAAANEQLNKLAEEAGTCKKADDPAGVARVQITFEPSGAVKDATVEKGALSGKPVGKCLAKLFKGAQVPPFKGEPVTITKSVVLH